MNPGYRGNRGRRLWRWFLVWFFATAAVLVIGLVVEQAVSPGPADHWGEPPKSPAPSAAPATRGATPAPQPKPAATPAASNAPSLTGPVQVVQGRQLVNGVYLGYPDSTVGAVSAADEFLSAIDSTLDPDRAAAVMRLAADPSYANGPQQAAAGVVSDRKGLGLPASGAVPQGASVETEPVEYQVRDVTPDRVTVLLLCDFVTTLPGQGTQTKVGVFPLSLHWTQNDWKVLPQPSANYENLSADPGSPQAAGLGWQQLEPAGG